MFERAATSKGLWIAALALASSPLALSSRANAQASVAPQFQDPPEYRPIVEGVVNVGSGSYVGEQALSIGQPGKSGLTVSGPMVGHYGGWNQSLMLGLGGGTGNWHTFLHQVPTPQGQVPDSWGMVVAVAGRSYSFFCVGSASNACQEWGDRTGATVTYDGTRGGYLWTGRDGTIALFSGAEFPNTYMDSPVTGTNAKSLGPTYIIRPDGEKITFYPNGSIVSSLGYMARYNGSSSVLINMSKEYCDPSATSCILTKPWPILTYGGTQGTFWPGDPTTKTETITNALGQTTTLTATGDDNWDMLTLTITLPSGRTTNITYDTTWDHLNCNIAGGPICPTQHVSQVVDRGKTWNYSYQYNSHNSGGWYSLQTTTSRPDGATAVVETQNTGQGFRFVDGDTRTTSVDLVQPGNLTVGTTNSVTYPSGKNLAFGYGAPGNVTSRTLSPATGSSLPALSESFTYGPTGCTPVNCNQVWSHTDAKGNTANYTYDPTHGGVLTETLPADANGVTPQKRYSYTQLYPQILNSSGTLVNSDPVWRLTRVSECLSATASDPASCVGTAQERVTTYAYSDPNLLPTSLTVAAGDGSVSSTTSYRYDDVGNVVSIDGPRTDIDDRTYATYDALRRKVFEIGADPDGAGPLPRQITHHVYDVDGNETRTEFGTGFATDGSDFVLRQFKRMTFDPTTGLLTKVEEVMP